MNIDHRISMLREQMKINNIDACIVPTSDRHQSEYVPSCWNDREWISGFTGSAGLAIITHSEATLWTDARYFIQAEEELERSEFELRKQLKRYEPEHLIYLSAQLNQGDTVCYNGWNFTAAQVKELEKYFAKKQIKLIDQDLIGLIWTNRPPKSDNEIFEHDLSFCGLSRDDKFRNIRERMSELDASYYIISALDEIAWLTNLRGSDVDFNPVFISYLVLGLESCDFFVDSNKFFPGLAAQLIKEGITLHEYDNIENYISKIPKDQNCLMDQNILNSVLYNKVNGLKITEPSIVQEQKGIKNEIELSNWDNAMVKDGVALSNAFYWLEKTLEIRQVSEAEFGEKLSKYRSLQELYVGESFPPIVGYNGNGAIIHYHAVDGKCKMIKNEGILLVDSGGQYLDGTTDITRTIALSEPSMEAKSHFTLVLKGMIGLTKAIFPEGTTGGQLDVLARHHLWSEGLDFPHGTGHGVGFFLNVHEGPQGFAPITTSRGKLPLKAGMITSNEPGYYIPDSYGIRIENLIVTKPSKHEGYLCFETNTLFPIDQRLIDETKMDAKEKAWFNKYHYEVYEKLSPHLEDDMKSWLKRKCKPLN